MAQLAKIEVELRFYTHINNTNPMLLNGSREARAVLQGGWHIAKEGLEIEL